MAGRLTTAALRTYLTVAGWRVRVEGREHLQGARRECSFQITQLRDVLILVAVLGVDYHFVAKGEVRSMPFVRTFLRQARHYAFNRADSSARLQQLRKSNTLSGAANPSLYFRKEPSTAQAGVRAFHLGAFKARSRPGGRLCRGARRHTPRAPRRRLAAAPVRITVTICPPILPQSDAADWHEIVRVARCRAGNNCPSRRRTSALICIFPRATTAQK